MRTLHIRLLTCATLLVLPCRLIAESPNEALTSAGHASLRAVLVIAGIVALGTLAGWILAREDEGSRRFW